MRRRGRIALFLLAVVAALTAWFVPPQLRFLSAACAHAAKVAASACFVGQRSLDDVRREELARFAMLSITLDEANRSATATAFVIVQATARVREGLGATLVHEPSRPLVPDRLGQPIAAAAVDAPWPEGEALDASALTPSQRARLARVIDAAFADAPDAGPARTRAVVVAWRGRLVAERLAQGFAPDVPQHGWSMSKTVLATLFGVLARQGRVDLQARAPLAAWRDAHDGRETITVDQLLRMESGLRFVEDYEDPDSDALRMLFLVDDMAAHAASRAIDVAPDRRWQYSSGTSLILSRLLREIVGEAAIPGFAREALFRPMGMRSALVEFDGSGTPVLSSYVWASPRDWARLGQLWLQDGVWRGERLLAEGFVAYATTPTPHAPQARFGAHVWLNAGDAAGSRVWPDLPRDVFWAAGFDGQYLVVIPSHQLVVVRLGQTPDRRSFDLSALVAGAIAAVGAD